ncbi:DUF6270 domain-containing protein [Aquibacillus kalidii]|uniref:DUF6270 domain-containing protein n=1 Tax=Aquibacillus kalidii TaxID=2762597 RepID=UPI0016465A20|nr:DUF6270 domain-containing protein [Aquibacillus kalidii]
MPTIDIFGSCVTRDAFSFIQNEYKINNYFARCSLISLYSMPFHINIEEIKLKSKFQQRILYYDLSNYFRSYLQETNSDYLIIDLIDERLGVQKYEDKYITNSTELNRSNLLELYNTEICKIDSNYIKCWENSARHFIDDLKKSPYKKIFLHKSLYVNTYLNKDNIKVAFDNKNQESAVKNNGMLRHMYNFLENNYPNLIKIEPTGFSADANHKWGLSPFHYEVDYYKTFMDKLNQFITG